METTDDGKGRSDCKVDPSAESESKKLDPCLNGVEEEECSSLLSPRRGGMLEKPKRSRRKVQWNDKNGDKLVEVLEFQPRLYVQRTLFLFFCEDVW
ncbi:hypothetical protein Sjap_008400 [Stephania japonica]|uniref:Uncharacterized protein n=1 Tax=Stephania japonica TaxID=461633 RepID=A0AAP0JQ69_9MAGN